MLSQDIRVSGVLQVGVLGAWTRATLTLNPRTGSLSAASRRVQLRAADVTHSRRGTSVVAAGRRPALWSLRPASDTSRAAWRAFANALTLAARSPPGFRLLRALGSGGSGTVYEAAVDAERTKSSLPRASSSSSTDSSSSSDSARSAGSAPSPDVAVKLIPRALADDCAAELRMAKRALRHPCLLAPQRAFYTRAHLVVVMPLARAGSLLDLARHSGAPLPMARVRRALRDVLSALQALHARGIAHRDVKLENVLLDSDGAAALADFGLADRVPRGGFARAAGTRYTQAPEVGVARYGTQADMWSAGVVLLVLLVRAVPFADDVARDKLLARMRALDSAGGDPLTALLGSRRRSQAPPALLHLLRGLLAIDPAKRLTAKQALAHPWFAENDGVATKSSGDRSGPSFATLAGIKLRLHRAVMAMRFRRQSLESVEGALVRVENHAMGKRKRSLAAVATVVRIVQGMCNDSSAPSSSRKMPPVRRAAEAGERVLSGILSRQSSIIAS